jgi:REP element-mobilizing transposase RayT
MFLNDLGIAAEMCWKEIPNHYKNVESAYYVIMPNHIHRIIIIKPNVETGYIPSQNKQNMETPCMASLPLGDIIGKFKAAVTRWANENGYTNFSWQPRFYDRIIRNEKELYKIRKYITENPLKWEIEKNSPENIFDT